MLEKTHYDPYIEQVPRLRDLSPLEADALIAQNPAYGEIVCRCEKISEGEIISAIRHGHTTLDGIKFYTRAQMGRCQGGFCTHRILKIIERETGLTIAEITKRGSNSYIASEQVGNLAVEDNHAL